MGYIARRRDMPFADISGLATEQTLLNILSKLIHTDTLLVKQISVNTTNQVVDSDSNPRYLTLIADKNNTVNILINDTIPLEPGASLSLYAKANNIQVRTPSGTATLYVIG